MQKIVAASALNRTRGRRLIADSGASYHLVDAASLTEQERANKKKLEVPILLNSANGEVWAEWYTEIYVPQLGITVEALVLDDTQDVLAIGKLVNQHGFSYYWDPGTDPILVKKGESFTM